jgi:putative membrane protein
MAMRDSTKWFGIGNVVMLIIFTLLYSIRGNYEFLGYAIATLLLVIVLMWSDKWFKFSNMSYILFSIWMFLHMFGGWLIVGDGRLYDVVFYEFVGDPFHILRYDQIIHAFCYFMFTLVTFDIVKSLRRKVSFVTVLVAVLASIGIGSLNEVIEFGMVIFLGAGEAVGGYINTGLDMVANLLGAVLAGTFLWWKRR